MKNSLPNQVTTDIQLIKNMLGEHLVSVSLFGSSSYASFAEANDIDLAFFVKDISLEEVRDLVLKTELNFPTDAKHINGRYTSSIKDVDKTQKYYDLIILDSENPNDEFMRINQGQLIKII